MCVPVWYNGLASEGEGSSPPPQPQKKVVDKLTTMWYTGDSREGNRTTPQKKVLDNHSKVWYDLGKSSVRHGNHSLKSLPCTACKPQKKVLDKRMRAWYNVGSPNLDNTSSVAKAKLPVTTAKLEGQMHRASTQGLVQLAVVASPFSMVKKPLMCVTRSR